MKRIVLRSIVWTCLFALGPGLAGAAAEPAVKIATVNLQKALNEVEQGRRAKDALKVDFEAKQKKLSLQQGELQKMGEEIEKQKLVISPETLEKKQRGFLEKSRELQQTMAGFQRELMEKEAKLTRLIIDNLKVIVGNVAQKEGYVLVVETSQDAVLYAKSGEDITERVIGLYNKKYTGKLSLD